jgi:cation diffusion facilitator CzcD-associated flavoprotein CzcO
LSRRLRRARCAIRLRQEGIDDFLVFERAGDLGGAWRDNSCQGYAGDVPSHLCCFSVRAQPWPEPVVLSLDPPKH